MGHIFSCLMTCKQIADGQANVVVIINTLVFSLCSPRALGLINFYLILRAISLLFQSTLSGDFTSTPAHPSNHSTPSTDDEMGKGGRYTLHSVKKIDIYSRRIFPTTYILFVMYFFIRYHAIEGALSIDYHYY